MPPKDILYQKYQDIFDFVGEVIAASPKVVAGQNANTLARQITLFHYTRALNLFDAINLLCVEGYATGGMVILRSLLNLYINLKWLTADDSEYRMRRYADFEVVFKMLARDAVIKYGSIGDEIKEDDFTAHEKSFEQVKEKYNLKANRDLLRWSGKSIYEMAEDVGLERDYKIIYGELSHIEHTGPGLARHYLDDSEKGATTIKIGPKDLHIDLVLLTSLDYFLNVKGITHNIFDVPWSELENDRGRFSSLTSKYWDKP